ncbi:hypothetical protein GUJ93_ZPchr0014g46873 [Zizania palustris]|uniref:Uncharacterized protein n=1 Tax=Zizania palustris TaxID=103762 RepID=A0A8J5SXA2_ZIZPA|nr:hypothetical protein GUJ93_ZPchr0014g46873 [Zizania palustris]
MLLSDAERDPLRRNGRRTYDAGAARFTRANPILMKQTREDHGHRHRPSTTTDSKLEARELQCTAVA